jgi:hypothetical protein
MGIDMCGGYSDMVDDMDGGCKRDWSLPVEDRIPFRKKAVAKDAPTDEATGKKSDIPEYQKCAVRWCSESDKDKLFYVTCPETFSVPICMTHFNMFYKIFRGSTFSMRASSIEQSAKEHSPKRVPANTKYE